MNRSPRPTTRLLVLLVSALAVGIPQQSGASDAEITAGLSSAGSRLGYDLNFGYVTGSYGTDETTEIQIVSSRLRWRLPRGELRVSFPLLRLSTTGEVTVVGGAPIDSGSGSDKIGRDAGQPAGEESRSEAVSGIGDVSLQGELDLMRGGDGRPWLTGVVRVKLPTADEEQGLGTGETDTEGGLRLMQPLMGRAYLLLDASYTLVGDPLGLELEDIVVMGAGISKSVGQDRASSLYAYVENRTHPTPGRDDRLDLALGVSRRMRRGSGMRLAGSLFVGLSDTAEDFGLSLVLGRSF